jgi:excisionase family DNA binding protein
VKQSPTPAGLAQADDRPQLLTVEETGRMLSMSRTSIYALMDNGSLPYHKIGRARRLALADVRALLGKTMVSRGSTA